MIKRSITFVSLALALSTMCQAQSRKVIHLPSWDFSRDGNVWSQVAVPHDWAIAGPFDKKWDLQMVAIEQNGEKEKTEKSGRSGALPWIGEGMYKMNLQLPKGYKRAVLVFDGAMSQPVVSVNGKEAGRWAYGYNAFRIDITPYVKFGGKKNLVEVHLNNVEESSRWYPGGGLYRPVSVELYGNENFSTWDTFVRTLKADKQEAEVEVNALLEGKIGKSGKTVIALLDEAGTKVAEQTISGEPVTGLAEGRPMFVRSANDHFNLANFMRANLYASVAVLKIGNDVLFKDEKVQVDRITGHGGLFKTKGVGQRILAAAINSPISVMETAGEGGAWGIALLAGYLVNNDEKLSLADYLDKKVFAGNTGVEIAPTAEDVAGFDKYIETYKAGLAIEQAAVANKK